MTDQPQDVDQEFIFNGIRADTGEPVTHMTTEEAAKAARGQTIDAEVRHRGVNQQDLGAVDADDQRDLTQTGWGIIFSHSLSPTKRQQIREALEPLLKHRKQMTAERKHKRFYRELTCGRGESYIDFLVRNGAGTGQANPETGLPYYLLIVADPQDISYDFQYQLDVQYSVGRLWFGDNDAAIPAYEQYAKAVVSAECEQMARRDAAFFGVSNPDDRATQISAEKLIKPLTHKMQQRMQDEHLDWNFQTIFDEAARKQRLAELLKGGSVTPAFLFSASHGIEFPADSPHLFDTQGALLCQDWGGPVQARGPLSEDWYFSVHDLESSANLQGLIAFFFACYGAGTPERDEYTRARQTDPIAPYPFVARLPQQMLRQGALAVIGHVGRAWAASFVGQYADTQLNTFETAVKYILSGWPVGWAVEWFNLRYAELATILTWELKDEAFGKRTPAWKISNLWIAHNDARSYMLLGDPAVRLLMSEQDRSRFIHGDTSVDVACRPKAEWEPDEKTLKKVEERRRPVGQEPPSVRYEIQVWLDGEDAPVEQHRTMEYPIDTPYTLTITPTLPCEQSGVLLIKSDHVKLEGAVSAQGDTTWLNCTLHARRPQSANSIRLTITPYRSGTGTIQMLLIDNDFESYERKLKINTMME